ncbi:SWIM zinc finger family protein [Sphingosinithalassobacter portus]|uniref:SWIM zinc finger family protein n=1 Tax=Stakelama portus TaxID=2676234 RepID=UPI000D6DE2AB|nr:SWIM zinc finger family protein [Sphingosinithalassobacter portus]
MTLAAILMAFDEAALAALANKGIVRRAARDVEEGKASISGWEGETAIVSADGETVRIDARGPAKASCTCPAPGTCRHRIAAVLLLQQQKEEVPEEDAVPNLTAEIAALPEDVMIRFAGRAAWRAAQEIAANGGEVSDAGATLVITLHGEDVEIRYLRGLGIEGMVSKASSARRKALHAAALILARQAAGVAVSELSAEAEKTPASIDEAFLGEVRDALADACRNGLTLAPLTLEERLFTLSVSSRADSLPRLSAMLRGIARMLRERRTRDFRFDPDACLGAIAAADALARALPAVSDPERRAGLIGTVRQTYDEVGPLHLYGAGGETWRAEGGARGAVAYFYDPACDRWFTASMARGAGQDPFFDPRHAFASEAIWGGQTLAGVSRAEFRFDSVAGSPGGRLSTSAASSPEISGATMLSPDWACAFDRWDMLAERLRTRLVGSLAAPAAAQEPVVLWPRRTGRPWFDDLAQQLHWPLEDRGGQWLAVSLGNDPDRPAHLDHLASAVFRPGFSGAVIAIASVAGAAFELRPMALFDEDGVRSLDFQEPSTPKRSFSDFLQIYSRRNRSAPVPYAKPAGISFVENAATELTGIAETGCRAISRSGSQRLAEIGAQAERIGLRTVAETLALVAVASGSLASQVLISRYIVDQTRLRLAVLPMLRL